MLRSREDVRIHRPRRRDHARRRRRAVARARRCAGHRHARQEFSGRRDRPPDRQLHPPARGADQHEAKRRATQSPREVKPLSPRLRDFSSVFARRLHAVAATRALTEALMNPDRSMLTRREMVTVGTGLLAAPILMSIGGSEAAAQDEARVAAERSDATAMRNPLTEYPKPPFKQ